MQPVCLAIRSPAFRPEESGVWEMFAPLPNTRPCETPVLKNWKRRAIVPLFLRKLVLGIPAYKQLAIVHGNPCLRRPRFVLASVPLRPSSLYSIRLRRTPANDWMPRRHAWYFPPPALTAQTPAKHSTLRLSVTKNLQFALAPFPGFAAPTRSI